MKKYANLVWSLLNEDVRMAAVVLGENDVPSQEISIEFSEDMRQKKAIAASGGEDDGLYWVARAMERGRPSERFGRRIQIDLEILENLEDILYVLGAYIAPGENMLFRVRDKAGRMLHTFRLRYLDEYASCDEEYCA